MFQPSTGNEDASLSPGRHSKGTLWKVTEIVMNENEESEVQTELTLSPEEDIGLSF